MADSPNLNKGDDDPLNNLPEYEIRTMQDDLDRTAEKVETKSAKLELPKLEKILPQKEKIGIPALAPELKPVRKAPLPSIEEFIAPVIVPSPRPAPPKPEIPLPPRPEPIPPKPLPQKAPAPIPKSLAPRHGRKFFLLIIIILAIAVAAGIFFYWYGSRPEPEPKPSPPANNEISIPEPLFRIDSTEKIFLSNDSLLNFLRTNLQSTQNAQTIKRIVLIKNETGILSLSNLIQKLGIAVYPYVLSELNDNYTFGFYAQDDKKRICLAIETNNAEKVKEQLRFWEKTMFDDLKNLFLDEKLQEPSVKSFKNNVYKGVEIRYLNLPNPDLTIDYAVVNNLLILSTSKAAMYEIIDRIKL